MKSVNYDAAHYVICFILLFSNILINILCSNSSHLLLPITYVADIYFLSLSYMYRFFMKKPLRRSRRRWKDNIRRYSRKFSSSDL